MSDAPSTGKALTAGRIGWRALAVLFKLRVVWLLLLAAIGGAFLAAGGWPGWQRMLALVLAGGITAAGASALNQWLERDSDGLMERTRQRPLVSGELRQNPAIPLVALLMTLLPALVVFPCNATLSLFLLLGAFIYVVIYTLWLKPRTLLNIVIGGAAGCAAVLSGSAAAGQWNHPAAVVLALMVFLWTPTHFWSLAVIYRQDYSQSHVPMLPVQATPRTAAGWILLHTGATVLGGVLLALSPGLGWLYAVPVAAVSVVLLWQSGRLWLRPERPRAVSLFKMSNIYLGIVLLLICLDSLL